MRRTRAGKGFTMVELVVALVILGILMGMAIPAYLNFMTSTRAAQAVADLQAMRAAVFLYYGDMGRWPNESQAGIVPKGVQQNLPKNFAMSNRWYTIDYDNWVPLHRQGKAPNGTTVAVGVSVISRDPRLLSKVQSLLHDAKIVPISRTKYTLEIATMDGF